MSDPVREAAIVIKGERRTRPRASIIIPLLNQLEVTEHCLTSIERHTHADDYELILVNNGSTDGTREFLDSLDRVVAIHLPENIGVGPAWNVGIEHSRGDHVCILNNDILVTPDWLDKLLWPFSADDRIWCTGPLFTAGNVPIRFDELAEFVGASEPTLTAGGIVGFCFALKRAAIEELGLFDEQFAPAWYEDTDYYVRLLQTGHPPALATDCLIHHFETITAENELSANAAELLHRNKQRFKKKWGRIVDPGIDEVFTLPMGQFVVRQPASGTYPVE